MKKIVLTGGGSAGHVTPNLALVPYLKEKGFEIHYIGSENGIEREIVSQYENITYHSIRTGKLRRYFSLKNFTDPFKVIAGCGDAKKILKTVKPDVVFSKGGFVSVPVAVAASAKKIPVITHESDLTPGLANKIIKRFSTKICVTFPETLKHLPEGLGVHVGSPVRDSLYTGKKEKAYEVLKFSDNSKPLVLIMGGSLGARAVNNAVRANLSALCEKYNIVHLCGKNNVIRDEHTEKFKESYRQFEFVTDELPDLLAACSFVISRAGSNAIHEFAALAKPMLLIPLPLSASRGDQILNAKSFEKRGFAIVLDEDTMTDEKFMEAVYLVDREKKTLASNMMSATAVIANNKIVEIIEEAIDS